ncbi:MAG TPA: tetratricopeptide repeat protein [Thermodesulfobacteriota bacterium]|nr:tetratricopeptide repeat protein [Thermodesulfobacteriota bacterium]
MGKKGVYIIIVVAAVVMVAAGAYLLGTRSKTSAINGKPQGSKYSNGNYPQGAGLVNYNEILNDLKARLAEQPDDWDLNARVADIYLETRRYEDAIIYYKKAIELNPEDVDSYNDLGLAHFYLQRPLDGLKYVEDGIKRDPNYQRIWLTKGFMLAYGFGDRRQEAIAAWKKAEAINPSSDVGSAARKYLESEGVTKR